MPTALLGYACVRALPRISKCLPSVLLVSRARSLAGQQACELAQQSSVSTIVARIRARSGWSQEASACLWLTRPYFASILSKPVLIPMCALCS